MKLEDALVTTRGAGGKVPMVLGQAKGNKKIVDDVEYSSKIF